ncbi:unnamed protein product [Haemonchus placei]|uniref:Secreted protein n=1 Tax=Haemonchus placei TaxID=6290 RepID=A0A0N4WV22_HAEPC|nr:unnamed protein product [Haemonchus placei]
MAVIEGVSWGSFLCSGDRITFVMHLILVAVLVAIVSAQVFPDGRFNPASEPLPCGFSCSRRTAVTAIIDGVFSRAECSDRNGNIMAR